MPAAAAIQTALYSVLRGNVPLDLVLARDVYEGSPSGSAVYDQVLPPEKAEALDLFPYCVIGEAPATEFDTDDIDGQETLAAVHIWDKREGRLRAKQVGDLVYAALHDVALPVLGSNAIFCFWVSSESVPDPDPLTQHEVHFFRIVTQDG